MGAQQRVYKQKIKSAQGMKKIFKAKEMVAASRIAKAHARVTATTPYAEALTQAIGSVATHSEELKHPFLEQHREQTGRAGILMITADRGMTGPYSHNVIRAAEQLANKLLDEGKTPVMYVVGRKGDSYYRFRNRPPHRSWTPYAESELPDLGREISHVLTEDLLSEDEQVHLDELYVVGTKFISRFQQQTRAIRMVPMGVVDAEEGQRPTYPLYAFTPDPDSVIEELMPRYIESRIINILLQAMASEHASTQRAMKTATDNAETQIHKFTRLANSARQAEITQEITEIVGGADALAGTGRTDR
ncbi:MULTISPECIES: F0F1 ATP synthase subunit gamma [unclassified Brachybacterium]|uniref:F0F1 ATP synthase subunit gamma n=1 Tax=unclassified Brachybacterium TaxID=2623841 RepID=UPI000C80B874|nr:MULTISPECIES: F0F1 ATP synthase subunit gamma [unclassified Brachybacterium]PMC76631.1 F0F1 ATP synthase subunit gamma [Brachybacterium sp. UMB0905]